MAWRGVQCKHWRKATKTCGWCEYSQTYVLHAECGPKCPMHEFKTEVTIEINVGRCDECPMCQTQRTPGTGFGRDYLCKASQNKLIATYIEWDSEIPPVPDWCPFRKKEKDNGV